MNTENEQEELRATKKVKNRERIMKDNETSHPLNIMQIEDESQDDDDEAKERPKRPEKISYVVMAASGSAMNKNPLLLGKKIGYKALINMIHALWKPIGNFNLIDLDNDYFLVKFENLEDYTRVLTDSPWMIYGSYLRVQPWSRNFTTSEKHHSHVITWVRLPGLPYRIEAQGHSGGICVLWDNSIKVKILSVSNQYVHTHFKCLNSGDFNCILRSEERIGGSIRYRGGSKHFQDFIFNNELLEVNYQGDDFTWRRGKRKLITTLKTESDTWCEDHDMLKNHVKDYYEKLFTSDPLIRQSLEIVVWVLSKRLELMASMLILSKKLGHSWRKSLLTSQALPKGGQIGEVLNRMILVLLPKVVNHERINQFRPIILCHVTYKIITKVIANRLKPILPTMISNSQTSFIPGIVISDNIILAQEVIHSIKVIKGSRRIEAQKCPGALRREAHERRGIHKGEAHDIKKNTQISLDERFNQLSIAYNSNTFPFNILASVFTISTKMATEMALPITKTTVKGAKKAAKTTIKETILTSRLYSIDFDEMETLFNTEINKNLNQSEFEVLLQEFKTDYNQTLLEENIEDSPDWIPSEKRVFTVKYAYKWIANINNAMEDNIWGIIAKHNNIPRVKTFLWLIGRNRVLTNSERARRHVTMDTDLIDPQKIYNFMNCNLKDWIIENLEATQSSSPRIANWPNFFSSVICTQTRDNIRCKWQKPTINYCKINTDGTKRHINGEAMCRVVARDYNVESSVMNLHENHSGRPTKSTPLIHEIPTREHPTSLNQLDVQRLMKRGRNDVLIDGNFEVFAMDVEEGSVTTQSKTIGMEPANDSSRTDEPK
ncbi:hypothetical protein F3Y22_tig00110411pilonHSYRG00007 [Hibiscus syriacus]|uniref:DUF4283 domain-containing protein n=1 Tax=Hibiscus syriacus TaxID=106335 RepID=A0A6A3AN00_HIBSY|nr:hypothetical protein F3Y22_tig00110411pilonHSYRG00007 [Hibiscus syriacus]